MTTNAEARLAEMGITFPEAPAAIGDYIPVVQFGDMVVTSGQLPMQEGKMTAVGKIGKDLTIEEVPDPTPENLHQVLTELENIPEGERHERVTSIFLTKRDMLPRLLSAFKKVEEGEGVNRESKL